MTRLMRRLMYRPAQHSVVTWGTFLDIDLPDDEWGKNEGSKLNLGCPYVGHGGKRERRCSTFYGGGRTRRNSWLERGSREELGEEAHLSRSEAYSCPQGTSLCR